MLYSVHPKPALTPIVAIIAVFTSSNFAAVLTAFIRLASHVRPNSLHFVLQLIPIASVFTQLTSETQGGVEATSRVKPVPQTQAEALVESTGLVPAEPTVVKSYPHGVQTGVAVGSLKWFAAQTHAEAAVKLAGLDASTAPQDTQMGLEPDVSFQVLKGQSDVDGMQRLVDGSHIVPAPQSEACTGQTVAAVSPLPRQQQSRV